MKPSMNSRIGLLLATGSFMASTSVGLWSETSFAQTRPMLSQTAVEQELATVATHMAAKPNSYANATLISAEARGLTLSLHFRFKENRNLSVEQYGAQFTTSFCQNATMRQYTDQYGVVLNVDVDAPSGNGTLRFRIDRAACARTAGAVTAPPAPQARLMSRPTSTGPVGGQTCAAFVGQSVQAQSFDNAVARFAGMTPKSEFETTAQFEARQARAVEGLGGAIILEKAPDDRKFFEYDADRQVLRILPFAFDNQQFPAWEAFYSAGLNGAVEVSTSDNIDVVISSNDRITGSYEATNGFGAKTTVASVTRTVKAVFDHGPKLGGRREALFPGSFNANYTVNPVGEIQMTPDQARALKPLLRIGFVALPRAPFVVKGSTKTGRTTIQNPRDVTMDFTILTADIQCGLVMDQGGTVLGAYPTS